MKTNRMQIVGSMVVMGLLAAGCQTNPVTGEKELRLIPESQEIAMGVQNAPEFEKEFAGKVPNDTVQQYVSMVGQKIAAHADRKMPYEYAVLQSDVPNAFALPGGKIYITAGLLSRMSNERQLAAVLGHETVHVSAGHSVQSLQNQIGASVVVEIAQRAAGQYGSAVGTATKFVAGMANMKYSRNDEYEADKYGIVYMVRAGYNPWGMPELLQVLLDMSDSEPGRWSEMMQTHPLTSKRIEKAKEEVQSNHSKFSASEADPQAGEFVKMRNLLMETLQKSTAK